MTDNPLVSVIIPVYNDEEYLPQCLNSVINQTYKNIEIICVNDGSTDNSKEVIEKFIDSRIRIINQENKGSATTRNVGLKNAAGEYVLFLDADDWIDKKLIEITFNVIQSNNADIVMFDVYNVYDNSYIKVKRVNNFIYPEKIKVLNYKDDDNIRDLQCTAYTKLFRKDFLINNNLYFPDGMNLGEDVLFWFSLLFKNPKMVFISDFLYFYRKRSSSMTDAKSDMIDIQWNAYKKCTQIDAYKNASKLEQLYILDYNTRMAIYNYSAINSPSLFLPYEKSLKNFSKEYKNFKIMNLYKLRGYKLLKTRHLYTIGKKIYLQYLKLRYSGEVSGND